jgi:hypothetical protein
MSTIPSFKEKNKHPASFPCCHHPPFWSIACTPIVFLPRLLGIVEDLFGKVLWRTGVTWSKRLGEENTQKRSMAHVPQVHSNIATCIKKTAAGSRDNLTTQKFIIVLRV